MKPTLELTNGKRAKLTGRHLSALYHYGPIRTAVSALVDDSIKAKAGTQLSVITRDIVELIYRAGAHKPVKMEHPDLIDDYDWDFMRKSIRLRIKRVLI